MKRFGIRHVLMAALLAATTASAQEGYDPLRQITQQITFARLLIVQDTTGSMAWNVAGGSLQNGDDSVGYLYWKWSRSSSNHNCAGTYNGTSQACKHTYTLSWDEPSRMALVKNGLGNSVSVATGFTAPANWQTYWGARATNSNYPNGTTITWPAGGGSGPWTWTVNYPLGSTITTDKGPPIHVSCGDPGVTAFPGAVACTIADFPTAPPICATSPSSYACTPQVGWPLDGTLYSFSPPADAIGANKDVVRWGLVAFSSSRGGSNECTTAQLLVPLDTSSAAQDVSLLENYYQLTGDVVSGSLGLRASGGTNTIGALTYAKGIVNSTYKGGTVTVTTMNSSGGVASTSSKTLAADPRQGCNPPYGVILATDGLSNDCNPNGGDWISPCGSGPLTCDVGSSGIDCPSTPSSFAAQQANDIWNLSFCPVGTSYCAAQQTCRTPAQHCCPAGQKYCVTTGSCVPNSQLCANVEVVSVPAVHPRTWTIGVSSQVGPCELDYIAYCGRTDASSKNNDAGYAYKLDFLVSGNNTYFLLPQSDFAGSLPNPAPSQNSPETMGQWYDGPTGQYKWFRNGTAYDPATKTTPWTGHGEYAFFATKAGAIAEAFTRIVDATGTGDYATGAPTAGAGIGSGTTVVLPSTDFPGWKGHVYWFDISQTPATRLFDAADAAHMRTPASRQIYTWDSSKNLVPVTTGNLASLQTIAGSYGLSPSTKLTAAVVDFIRGNDGTLSNTMRTPSYFGPFINTTPAITAAPPVFHQHQVADHSSFEQLYASRRPLVWMGSDDGMLHAFDFTLGREELAILPPDLLPIQVQFYANYLADPVKSRVTGQPDRTTNHIYGVANSMRYGDVFFQSDGQYRTVALLTEGPGGKTIAALDITHPYGGNPTATPNPIDKDQNYDAANPFKVLWSTTGGSGLGQLNGLFNTWSIPAMGSTVSNKWNAVFGAGYNTASTASGQVVPKAFTVDLSSSPTNPTFNALTLNVVNGSPSPLVGNQTFADSVVYSTAASGFHSDNLADLALQADLNGRIWFFAGDNLAGSVYIGIDANAVAGGKAQPIYYSPAVSGYGSSVTSCDTYAFGSGSFYEKSQNVTGPNVGSGSNFIPSLYIGVGRKPANGNPAAALATGDVMRIPIAGTWQITTDGGTTYQNVTLGPHSQLTAPPFVISPFSGSGPIQAIFAVYDPDNGCNGHSYVLTLTVDIPANCTGLGTAVGNIAPGGGGAGGSGSGANHIGLVKPNNAASFFTGSDAGSRAVSGLTSTGPGKFAAAVSGIGQGTQATIIQVNVQQNAQSSGAKAVPVWWKEHK